MESALEARAVRGSMQDRPAIVVMQGQAQTQIKSDTLIVGVYSSPSRRGKTIVANMYEGIKARSADVPIVRDHKLHAKADNFRAVVFYGLRDNLLALYLEYRRKNVATMFFDMGYWGRGKGEMLSGFHGVAINALQPNA